jgi:hypothetical protein
VSCYKLSIAERRFAQQHLAVKAMAGELAMHTADLINSFHAV